MIFENAIKDLRHYQESSPVGRGRVLVIRLEGNYGVYRSAVNLADDGTVTKKDLAKCLRNLADMVDNT